MNFGTSDLWHAIILYGKQQSTYKIALGRLLVGYGEKNSPKVTLDELAEDFFEIYKSRLGVSKGKPQNSTLGRMSYAEHAVKGVESGSMGVSEALELVKNKSLKDMVLQKFHTLNNVNMKNAFYSLSDDGRYLVLTDALLKLAGDDDGKQLVSELDSRWDLLEQAFEDTNHVDTLVADEYLKYLRNEEKRTDLTPLIPMLSGYQQERCFYCGEKLYDTHVDHVIPYQAIRHNQTWNLVLAHNWCNERKSDNLPPKIFVENLIVRNEYLIRSDHPLKQQIMKDIGTTSQERRLNIERQYKFAQDKIKRVWEGNDKYDPSKDEFYKGWVNYFGEIQKSNSG